MARSTLVQVRNILRGMVEAGTADYTLGTISFWDDDQMDTVLDQYRADYVFEPASSYPTVGAGGTAVYNEYRLSDAPIEQTSGGTAVFWLQDGTGATIGTALYSVDYLRGVVTFAADTGGTSYYANYRAYDLNGAAADIWRKKAAHYSTAFNFTTDNHKVDREAIYKHCLQMAERFESMGAESVVTMQVWRSDTDYVE